MRLIYQFQGAERSHPLGEGDTDIGRDPACGLCLDDPKVSKLNARCRVAGGVVRVSDPGSRNGILINGQKVLEGELRPGDELKIGPYTLRLAAEDAAPAALPATPTPQRMPAPAPPPRLRIINPGREAELVLSAPRYSLGSGERNDLVLAFPGVSAYHAELALEQDGWYLKDLGSLMGSYVNRKEQQRARLRPGDLIFLGEAELVFESSEALPWRAWLLSSRRRQALAAAAGLLALVCIALMFKGPPQRPQVQESRTGRFAERLAQGFAGLERQDYVEAAQRFAEAELEDPHSDTPRVLQRLVPHLRVWALEHLSAFDAWEALAANLDELLAQKDLAAPQRAWALARQQLHTRETAHRQLQREAEEASGRGDWAAVLPRCEAIAPESRFRGLADDLRARAQAGLRADTLTTIQELLRRRRWPAALEKGAEASRQAWAQEPEFQAALRALRARAEQSAAALAELERAREAAARGDGPEALRLLERLEPGSVYEAEAGDLKDRIQTQQVRTKARVAYDAGRADEAISLLAVSASPGDDTLRERIAQVAAALAAGEAAHAAQRYVEAAARFAHVLELEDQSENYYRLTAARLLQDARGRLTTLIAQRHQEALEHHRAARYRELREALEGLRPLDEGGQSLQDIAREIEREAEARFQVLKQRQFKGELTPGSEARRQAEAYCRLLLEVLPAEHGLRERVERQLKSLTGA